MPQQRPVQPRIVDTGALAQSVERWFGIAKRRIGMDGGGGRGGGYQGSVGWTSTPLTRSDLWKKERCTPRCKHRCQGNCSHTAHRSHKQHMQHSIATEDRRGSEYLDVQTERLRVTHIVVRSPPSQPQMHDDLRHRTAWARDQRRGGAWMPAHLHTHHVGPPPAPFRSIFLYV
jgi:hypothetical protein